MMDKKKMEKGADNPLLQSYIKQLQKLTRKLGFVDTIDVFILNFFSEEKEIYDPFKKYSKNFFQKYYKVDYKTFCNWLEIYCPAMNNKFNSSGRKYFTSKEWNIIMSKIGWVDDRKYRPYTKIEIVAEMLILDDINPDFAKSMYVGYRKAFDNLLNSRERKLKKLPPVKAHQIIKDLAVQEFKPEYLGSPYPPCGEAKIMGWIESLENRLKQSYQEEIGNNRRMVRKLREFRDEWIEELKVEAPDSKLLRSLKYMKYVDEKGRK